jgi:hypothetical protein
MSASVPGRSSCRLENGSAFVDGCRCLLMVVGVPVNVPVRLLLINLMRMRQ